MDELANFKKIQINNYFSSIYDLSDHNIDLNQIKNDLHQIIGEIPGVELNYETETLVNEDESETIKQEKLASISIYYTFYVNVGTDEEGRPIDIPRFEKVTYII